MIRPRKGSLDCRSLTSVQSNFYSRVEQGKTALHAVPPASKAYKFMVSVARQKLPAANPPGHLSGENTRKGSGPQPDPQDRRSFHFIDLPSACGEASDILESADRNEGCPKINLPVKSGSLIRPNSNLKTHQPQIRIQPVNPFKFSSHKMVHIKLTQPTRPSQETETPETPTTHFKRSLRKGLTGDRSALSSHFPMFTISGSLFGEAPRMSNSHFQQSDLKRDNEEFGIDTNVDYFRIYMEDQELVKFCTRTKPESHYCDMTLQKKPLVAPVIRAGILHRSELMERSYSCSSD
jgi:hypothetical protein